MQRKVLFVMLVAMLLIGLVAPVAFADGPVQPAAEQYYSGGLKTIKAADLYANLNDGDTSNDPYLVDLRAAADFANGHIKGANNVDVKTLFTAAELAKLPTDRPIVVNCYSGQTSGQAVAALQMLGYDAYSLTYGIPSWGTNDNVTYPFTATGTPLRRRSAIRSRPLRTLTFREAPRTSRPPTSSPISTTATRITTR
jgi:rhodanese-related sulfurtransferase